MPTRDEPIELTQNEVSVIRNCLSWLRDEPDEQEGITETARQISMMLRMSAEDRAKCREKMASLGILKVQKKEEE